jgi:mRNA-degrading endonuclease RelE of RelBE toxin-antitoxin system
MVDRIQKALWKIPAAQRKEIENIIACIIKDDIAHLDVKKLQGHDSVYRVRKGNFRIIFFKTSADIRILAVERRADTTYKKY